jgi:hypothetical protein
LCRIDLQIDRIRLQFDGVLHVVLSPMIFGMWRMPSAIHCPTRQTLNYRIDREVGGVEPADWARADPKETDHNGDLALSLKSTKSQAELE